MSVFSLSIYKSTVFCCISEHSIQILETVEQTWEDLFIEIGKLNSLLSFFYLLTCLLIGFVDHISQHSLLNHMKAGGNGRIWESNQVMDQFLFLIPILCETWGFLWFQFIFNYWQSCTAAKSKIDYGWKIIKWLRCPRHSWRKLSKFLTSFHSC